MTDVDTVNEGKLLSGLLEHLKSFKCQSKKSSSEFCSLIFNTCGENLQVDSFFNMLAKKIGRKPNRLATLLNNWQSETRGRNIKQKIYDTWHQYSLVTVDRRNGWD